MIARAAHQACNQVATCSQIRREGSRMTERRFQISKKCSDCDHKKYQHNYASVKSKLTKFSRQESGQHPENVTCGRRRLLLK